MSHMKTKVIVIAGLTAISLAAGGPAAYANPGSSYDTFGVYVSSPSGATLNGDDSINNILWDYGNQGDISQNRNIVHVGLKDIAPDGNGPIARAKMYGTNGKLQDSHDFHNTKGNGQTLVATYVFSGSLSSDPHDVGSITIQICNGYSASGAAQNCGAVHGPFHAY